MLLRPELSKTTFLFGIRSIFGFLHVANLVLGGSKNEKCEYLLNDAEWAEMDGAYPRRKCGARPKYTIITTRRGRVIR